MTAAATKNPTRSTHASGRDGTAESSPISQYAMPRTLLLGMVVSNKIIIAESNDAVMTPPSSSVLLSIRPSRRPRKYTAVIATPAPRNPPSGVNTDAISGDNESRGSSSSATIAPTAAPLETPSTYGSASGFRSSA